MFPSWRSKDSHPKVERTGDSLHSVRIRDDDNNDVREDIRNRSTHTAPIAKDTEHSFATSSNMNSLERSTDPAASSAMFRTPHDDILADLHGYLPLGTPAEQPSLRGPDAPPPGSSLNLGSSAAETSVFTAESLPSHEPAKGTMYDPSTGQRLYDCVHTPARSGADEELWSHLSRILELQSDIAKMHVDMENVGLRDARGHNGSGNSERGAKADSARSKTGKHRRRNESLEEQGDDETDGATEGEETDSDGEVFGKRRREEEFTRLVERFAKRKVAIDSVMDKLDDLSSTLKAFHALPTPGLDLTSSHTNTMLSNTSMTTSRSTGETPVVTSMGSAPPRLVSEPQVTTFMGDAQRVDSPLDMPPM